MEPDYVVVRRGPDMPDEWDMPPGLEGKWLDRATMPPPPARDSMSDFRARGGVVTSAAAVPTGRFEVRDDGAVAEVWEIRPQYR